MECVQNNLSLSDKFGTCIPCSASFFLEVFACVSLKRSTKVFFRGKKLLKLRFLDYFSKTEMEECDQEDWNFSNKNWSDCNKFGMIIYSSAPYFLEVDVRFSLKVVIKASYRGKKSSENLNF